MQNFTITIQEPDMQVPAKRQYKNMFENQKRNSNLFSSDMVTLCNETGVGNNDSFIHQPILSTNMPVFFPNMSSYSEVDSHRLASDDMAEMINPKFKEKGSLNTKAKAFRPKQNLGKRRRMVKPQMDIPEQLFVVSQVQRKWEDMDLKINCLNDSSSCFTNEMASTCAGDASSNYKSVLLTQRNSNLKKRDHFDDSVMISDQNISECSQDIALKQEKINQFRVQRKALEISGKERNTFIKSLHSNLKTLEFRENAHLFKADFVEKTRMTTGRDPIESHEVTKEYRTKMADWMIEVTTSFKCCPRTYFLSLSIFDKYLIAQHQNGVVITNADVHKIGVISMYMASKFEDVFPLHARVVSEKIAHGTMTPKQIVSEEQRFLNLFGFSVNFATHYDFYETIVEQIYHRINNIMKNEKAEQNLINYVNQMIGPLQNMSLLLVKMSLQCLDFCAYSPSIVVLSSLYASTAFVKHSKTYRGDFTSKFCQLVRKVIFDLLTEEVEEQKKSVENSYIKNKIIENVSENFMHQHTSQFVEQIAMDLVDFFKMFDSWHPGLNQLKKFNAIPFE